MERIRISAASKKVGSSQNPRTLWSNLDLHVNSGEVLCISGVSGSGKSTLLNCLGLIDSFDAGTYKLNGRDISKSSWRAKMKLRRHAIGYLFQDYALIENETIQQNIDLAKNGGADKESMSIEDALSTLGLSGRKDESVFQLSGGEQQRVAMARLLVRDPDIILADEPTASLDRKNAALVMSHLHEFAKRGAAVVIVSHDPWISEQCSTEMELIPNE